MWQNTKKKKGNKLLKEKKSFFVVLKLHMCCSTLFSLYEADMICVRVFV